jgi:hypothetical protein
MDETNRNPNCPKSIESTNSEGYVPTRLYLELERRFHEVLLHCEKLSERLTALEQASARQAQQLTAVKALLESCLARLRTSTTQSEVDAIAQRSAEISNVVLSLSTVLVAPLNDT